MDSSPRSVYLESTLLATLIPQSPYFEFGRSKIRPMVKYVLSRFAYLHKEEDQIVLESPLSYAKVVLHHWIASAFVHALAQPVSIRGISRSIPKLTTAAGTELMNLLWQSNIVSEAQMDGIASQERATALQSWEFQDFLFHARTRGGRHDHAAGGTYRLAGVLKQPTALKKQKKMEAFPLYLPDIETLKIQDPPYARIQEERCSIRKYSKEPITAQQLGEFLYRVGRIRDVQKTSAGTRQGRLPIDVARRPYPSGGMLYELELYVVIQRCKSLAEGLYFYDAKHHRLLKVSPLTDAVQRLLVDAGKYTMVMPKTIQTLILISARFQRIAWKYSTIAYALLLKNVGVLMQTMYLAATAMNLAPCAVGYGDSEIFARAAGTDYVEETSVGEFLLGSRPDSNRI